jgi:hypothetical protein
MSFRRSLLSVLLLGCVGGCARPDGEVIDAAISCEPARTVQCVVGPFRAQPCSAGDPIQVGTFCDEVFACVPDEAAAQVLAEVAPDFACVPGPGEIGACDPGQYSCHWRDPGTIDGVELEALCAVTVLPVPPALVTCMVYV